MHRNHHAISAAWTAISSNMLKPVEECKSSWKSLRDSMRYHQVKNKKLKSGSQAEFLDFEDDPVGNDDIDWEFAEDLAFMVSNSSESRRRTFSSSTTETSMGITNDNASIDILDDSNYSYTNSTSKKSKKTSDSNDVIAKAITDLVLIRKQHQETITSNEVQGPVLKYNSMFANLDRMFQQLPEDVVEDLNFRFISQTYDEIKKQKK